MHQAFLKNKQIVPEENNKVEKSNMEYEIKQWSTGKAKSVEELIVVTKENDACKIETCDFKNRS